MIKSEILVPLLNANEPEARLVAIHVKGQQLVEKGALLFTIETTKASTDIEAPETGFVRLLAAEGDTLEINVRLAVITETADEPLMIASENSSAGPNEDTLRMTKPARQLAEELGVDLASFPADHLITEAMVRELAGQDAYTEISSLQFTDSHILIYGGGGHAKAVMEMVRAIGAYQIAGIVDDGIPAGTNVLGIPVLGSRAILPQLARAGLKLAANGVGGIIDIGIRVKIFKVLEENGFSFPPLVHPSVVVEPSAQVGGGVQVFPQAYVGSSAVLQPRCMVNTGAIVSHDCKIGSYSHIAPGAMLAGHVHVGERTLVGMGVTTAIGIRIGNGARIGNSATLYADVQDRIIVKAGKVWGG